MRSLADVSTGENVKIVRVRGEGALRRRMMDLGLTKGAQVSVRKVAPLGDPMQIFVRGSDLSIRRSDAEILEVE